MPTTSATIHSSLHQDFWHSGGPAYKVFPLASPSSLGLINCLFVVNEQAFILSKSKSTTSCALFVILSLSFHNFHEWDEVQVYFRKKNWVKYEVHHTCKNMLGLSNSYVPYIILEQSCMKHNIYYFFLVAT